jgi:hypothetical protein
MGGADPDSRSEPAPNDRTLEGATIVNSSVQEAFAPGAGILDRDDAEPREFPEDNIGGDEARSLAELAEERRRQATEVQEGRQAGHQHDVGKEEAERRQYDAGKSARAIETEIIRRVLEQSGVVRVDLIEWAYKSAPIATAREGGRLFVVSPGDRGEWPCDAVGPDLAEHCTLTVIEDQGPPELSSVTLSGRVLGDPFVGRFIPSDEFEAMPEGSRPDALRVVGGGWVVVLEETAESKERRRVKRAAREEAEAARRAAAEAEKAACEAKAHEAARDLTAEVMARTVDRWEACRAALATIADRRPRLPIGAGVPGTPERAAQDAWSDAVELAHLDARQMEGLLGLRIEELSGIPVEDDEDPYRYRAMAVRHAGVLYVLACNPAEYAGDPNGPVMVVRLTEDRIIGLD